MRQLHALRVTPVRQNKGTPLSNNTAYVPADLRSDGARGGEGGEWLRATSGLAAPEIQCVVGPQWCTTKVWKKRKVHCFISREVLSSSCNSFVFVLFFAIIFLKEKYDRGETRVVVVENERGNLAERVL